MPAMTPAVQISKLDKHYPDVTALDGIALEIQPGDFYGLLGPNGAGKTTTINILAGLCNKTAGDVAIFGRDIDDDYRDCRRLVGLVPQEFNFDVFVRLRHMLVFQGGFFGLPRRTCEARADELLAEFDLTDKADTQLRNLSGGMKRRAIITRALMHRPKILILDEPTAGVDVDLRRLLWQYLRRLNAEGTTILLTTHYIEEAEALCDRIAIINEGCIVAVDTTRNLVARLTTEAVHITLTAPLTNGTLENFGELQVEATEGSNELTVTFNRRQMPYHSILERLIAAGVCIDNIRPAGNQLEQVFVNLTRQ
jgi:ABC-2 type transport system ATP-binding protein